MGFGVRRTGKEGIPADTEFYTCPLCSAIFEKKQDFRAHMKNMHPDADFKLP